MKDISVAEEKKEPEVPPSQVPDDPAILGVSLINFLPTLFDDEIFRM